MEQKLTVTFYGGAGTVTGSNFLLSDGTTRILIDCGLTQGEAHCRHCNFDDFEYDPATIDAFILTHTHLDHIGRAPKLFRDGFQGPVYLTEPSKDLAPIMLSDSVRILAREAQKKKIDPMYGEKDVTDFLAHMKAVPYHTPFMIGDFEITFKDAGHILGSAMAYIVHKPTGKKIVFSGDIGNVPSPFLRDTEEITGADYLIMESVYGDRLHEDRDLRLERLQQVVLDSIERGGVLMIPAFSIERTQVLLYELSNMFEDGRLPKVPVFLDSPLAIKVTDVYSHWAQVFTPEIQQEMKKEGNIFSFPFLTQTQTREESKNIIHAPDPKIVIAGAGMSHGGRIQHHEQHYLGDPKNTLLIVGYQAPGSLGRLLLDGAKKITINHKTVRVRARIEAITGFSAHADRDMLLNFVSQGKDTLKQVFTAMGEPSSASFLAQRIHDFLGVKASMPEQDRTYELT